MNKLGSLLGLPTDKQIIANGLRTRRLILAKQKSRFYIVAKELKSIAPD
jgi:hypothetical protein